MKGIQHQVALHETLLRRIRAEPKRDCSDLFYLSPTRLLSHREARSLSLPGRLGELLGRPGVGLALAGEVPMALSAAERLPSPLVRARLLTALIPCFSEFRIGGAAGRALAAALAIPDPAARADGSPSR